MAKYTERSYAHLIAATDCTVSFGARSKSKGAELGKCGASEIHLSAAQKFLSEDTGLCARNVDHGISGDKITCN
jgi:hypothetical protein